MCIAGNCCGVEVFSLVRQRKGLRRKFYEIDPAVEMTAVTCAMTFVTGDKKCAACNGRAEDGKGWVGASGKSSRTGNRLFLPVLLGPQPRVEATTLKQLGVHSAFDNSALAEHVDAVGVDDA